LDILRALPEKLAVSLNVEGEKVVIKAGRSRFSCRRCRPRNFR
jgi:DNA polymerase III sliding clamp (beta) subunit (PCNA family)